MKKILPEEVHVVQWAIDLIQATFEGADEDPSSAAFEMSGHLDSLWKKIKHEAELQEQRDIRRWAKALVKKNSSTT